MNSRVTTGLTLALIVLATAVPGSPSMGEATPTLCVMCGDSGLADFMLNIALYAPLGACLRSLRVGWVRAIGLGGLLSLLVEVLQAFVIAGRYASLSDLLSNTMGTGLGWIIWRGWTARTAQAPRTGFAVPAFAAVTTTGFLMVGIWLLLPDYPGARYSLQWTQMFAEMGAYEGQVINTRIGPIELSSPGPIDVSDSVHTLLRNGADVEATIRIGPAPPGLVPIVSIFDHMGREIIFLGADGHDLEYWYAMRGSAIRLDRSGIRFPGALAEVKQGDTIQLTVSAGRGAAPGALSWCIEVGTEPTCVSGFTASQTWHLLYYDYTWEPGLLRVLDVIWLAAVFAPVGLLGARWRDRGIAAALTAAGLTALPWILGFAVTSLGGILASLTGILIGGLVVTAVSRQSIRVDGQAQ